MDRNDIIRMGKEAGFNIGRDAGGEYVAPQYTDSVGTLERLARAAYAAGKAAERDNGAAALVAEGVSEYERGLKDGAVLERKACADLVRQLRDSITWFSHDSGAMRSALEQAETHIRARGKKGGV